MNIGCFDTYSLILYFQFLAEADEQYEKYTLTHGGARAKKEDKPSSVASSVTDIIKELSEMLQDSIGSFFTGLKDDDSTKDVEGNSTEVAEEADDDEDEEEEDDESNDTETREDKRMAQRSAKAGKNY